MLKLFYYAVSFICFVNGVWMLLLPDSWYTNFPGALQDTGPFNAHFVCDIGVAYIVVALGFAWCASHLDRSRPLHLGLTVFFAGHALIHVAEILTGRLPRTHLLIDMPSVFAPAVIFVALAVPSIRRRFGEPNTQRWWR